MEALSKKISSSRLLRLVLVGIITLLGIKIIYFGFSVWVIRLIEVETSENKVSQYIRILDIMSVSISGAIATIITAAIARYGLREATRNITLPGHNVVSQGFIDEGGK